MWRWRGLLPYVGLTAAIALAYWEIQGADFVNFDDEIYVSENSNVRAGLTLAGVAWAFTTGAGGHWEPLVWLSHMLVCQLFGLRPEAHHVANVLLHAANASLLFAVLRRMTGRAGPSALAAGLFALHPVHVESVAWVTERKDVLSALFLLLTLRAYLRYVERPAAGRLALTGLILALGLMAKPMLVTLPLLLLLLDYWPLGRLRLPGTGEPPSWRVLLEKLPLLALSIPIAVVTVWLQQRGGAVVDFFTPPIPERLGNALVSYLRYLGHLIWPADLTAIYPIRAWSPGQVALAGALLALGSGLALRWVKRFPFVFVGWTWYLVSLLPVIGVVQAGPQAMADRYAYLPSLGIYIAVAWGLDEFARRWPATRGLVAILGAGALLACLVQTRLETRYWSSSQALFERALAVTRDNWIAHHQLGLALAQAGSQEQALAHFRESIRIHSGFPDARFSLVMLLQELGQEQEALAELKQLVAIDPDSVEAHYYLAMTLARAGRIKQAIASFERALGLDPDRADLRYNLAIALLRRGEPARAVPHLERVLEQRPDAEVNHALGLALAASGAPERAVMHFREAVRLAPDEARYRLNLTRALERQARSEGSQALPE